MAVRSYGKCKRPILLKKNGASGSWTEPYFLAPKLITKEVYRILGVCSESGEALPVPF